MTFAKNNDIIIKLNQSIYSGVSPSGKAADSDSVIRGFKSFHPNHLYVTKLITYRKSPKFRAFLRITPQKFYSKNRGSPKPFFKCFLDLNGRFWILQRFQSRFGRKIPNSALYFCKKLSQSFKPNIVAFAELIEMKNLD